MKISVILPVIGCLLSGCSMSYLSGHVPFPHSSVVVEYGLADLRLEVEKQESAADNGEDPFVVMKQFPNLKEFKLLEAAFQHGDRIVKFKNDDWWVGIDRGSTDAETAFCLMRSGRRVKTIRIWPFAD